MKKIIVKQQDQNSCAVACILSIIRFYEGNISYEELSLIIKNTNMGANAYDILEGIKTIGFNGYGKKITFNELLNENEFPIVSHMKKDNLYHFVVIYKIDKIKNRITVMDPSKGLIKLSYKEFENNYLGVVLIIKKVGEIPKLESEFPYVKYLIKYLRKNKLKLIKILLLLTISIILTFINSYILKIILEEKIILNLLIIAFLIILIKNLLAYIINKNILNLEENIGIYFNKITLKQIFKIPKRYIKNKTTGDIISRIKDLDNFKEKIISLLVNLFVNIFLILITILILFFINKNIFYITLIYINLSVIVSLLYNKYIKKYIINTKENISIYESILNENIHNYNDIKNLKVENKVIKKIINYYIDFINSLKKLDIKIAIYNMFKNISSETFLLIIILICSYFANKSLLRIGDIIFIYSICSIIIEPLNNIVNYFVDIEEIKISFKRINELLLIRKDYNGYKLRIDDNIEVENLKVIDNTKDLTFKIKNKTLFLIYGMSGSGKSTFINILSKNIDNYEGFIKIGNKQLKDIDKCVIDNSFTLVTQEEHLFTDTIENNIKFFRNINKEKYEKILSITGVDKIINKKPFNDQYFINEDGVNLSGGERQKIILARNLLKKCNYLVLDEALSEVSFEDEIKILKNIKNSFKDLTIIYVSHKREIINYFKNKYCFNQKGGDYID